jgi:DNA-3-methyladenine glycosylase
MIALKRFLERDAEVVARDLLGSYLERTFEDGSNALVKIVETEAYDQNDVASHSYNGMTPRTEVMFGEPGYLYVYFTYGMHYCCNIVVGKKGHGSAILIRAVEPIEGEDGMITRRKGRAGIEVANGPAKLCQALSIDKALNKHKLTESPLKLVLKDPLGKKDIVTSTRIGISKGQEIPWRFYIKGNKYVSKP